MHFCVISMPKAATALRCFQTTIAFTAVMMRSIILRRRRTTMLLMVTSLCDYEPLHCPKLK